ncbi:hypothetical protein [Streptomyces alanosinicus]|uniref:Uncharacterized protein n=1 Tax=Streptomyces alanosinicus TaxID=68171 RepID=A0A919D6F2_9ACTN|nr:hypothetical protein [Streptomyces alanosinicus]GHE12097.1 hypothetical protein GCM10010339_74240 [Streptomyces alanosinicus]
MTASSGNPRPFALTHALLWRLLHEGRHHLLAPVLPFVAALAIMVLTSLRGSGAVNGAGSFLNVAARYTSGGHAVTVGILLTLGPALAALFNSMSVTRAVQGLVGAEVTRGGFEELLGAPYTPRRIAAAILGYMAAAATCFWAAYMAIVALATGLLVATTSTRLHLGAGYTALALVLPLLIALTGGSLALLVSLLFPRLTQIGGAAGLSGGNLGNVISMLPALGSVFVLTYGLPHLGATRLLVAAGGTTFVIAFASVTIVAACFSPETALDS